jgi:2-keto-4-pentenoate hydratase
MTGTRENMLQQAANVLLDARRTGETIADLPADLQPADLAEVYFIQDAMAAAMGEIGGWKIGAPTPEATPLFAPMPKVWMAANGSSLGGQRFRYRGLEGEVAFQVGKDLPPRAQGAPPYTREEVLDAMASCHPAVEVLESAFTDPSQASRLASLADLQIHGGFVFGPAYPGWRAVDFNREHVVLSVDGVIRVDRTGSNTSGDLLKLLPWLANEGASRTGGLRAGQWITTGSWTGNTPGTTGSTVEVDFSTIGRAGLSFA